MYKKPILEEEKKQVDEAIFTEKCRCSGVSTHRK